SFRIRRCWRERGSLRGGLLLGCKRLCWLSPLSSDCLGIADPDQNAVMLISGKPFRLNQIDLQILDVVVIQVKSALQDAIGNTLVPLKQLNDLGNQFIIVHGGCSAVLASAVLYP